MLRTCFYMAVVAIIFVVRSSEAANCTLASFNQDVSAANLAASKILAADYANSTKQQIVAQFLKQFNESVVSFEYNVTINGDTVSFSFKIIFACNETKTTVSPDGTSKSTEVKSSVDATKAKASVSAGLTDRCNQVSLKAQQVQSGANDTVCNFNAGGSNFFEWVIRTSSQTYTSSISAGSYANANLFHTALLGFYRTKLNALYPNQITGLTIDVTSSAGIYYLKFRLTFAAAISAAAQRTDIVTNIQTCHYGSLTSYFPSISKSITIPSSIKISVPTAISVSSKKAILIKSANSTKSLTSGVKVTLTKVSSSSAGVSKSSSSSSSSSKTSGTASKTASSGGSKTVTVVKSGSAKTNASKSASSTVKKSGSSVNVTLKGGSSSSNTVVKTGTASGSVSVSLGGGVSKTGAASGKTNVTVSGAGGKSGTKVSTTVEKTGSSSGSLTVKLQGASGNSSVTVKKASSAAKSSSAPKSTSGAKSASKSTNKSSSGSSTSGSGGSKTVTSTKEKTSSVNGVVSIKLPSGNGTSSSSGASKSSAKGTTKASSSGSSKSPAKGATKASSSSSGNKTVSKTEQKTQESQGVVSIQLPKAATASPTSQSASQTATKQAEKATSPASNAAATQAPQSTDATNNKNGGVVVGAVVANPKPTSAPKTTKAKTTKAASQGKTTQASKNGSAVVGAVVANPKPSSAPKTTKAKATKAASQGKTTQASKSGSAVVGAVVANKKPTSAPKTTKSKTGKATGTGKQATAKPSTQGGTKKKPSVGAVVAGKNVGAVVASGKGKKQKSSITIKTVTKRRGQSQGRRHGVTGHESNRVRDITIDTMPYEYQNTEVNTRYLSLLLSLLRGRSFTQSSSVTKTRGSGCAPQDIYVNYVYEYDIQNQVFNSSFQDPNSVVIRNLQSDIADWTAEEIYKRNLAPYVTDEARLTKIIDVSKQNENRATLRLYVSINVSKNRIPVIRGVLEKVCQKLQNERFATSNKKVDWGKMVLIPINK